MPTLAELFVTADSGNTAVIVPDGGPTATYGELGAHVEELAAALRRGGLRPGDPVAMVLENGLAFLEVFLAVVRARGVAAPLNPAYTAEELRFYVADAEAKAVIVPPGEVRATEAAAALGVPVWYVASGEGGAIRLEAPSSSAGGEADDLPRGDDVALFLHTSGTTSRPKGVPLTHANLMASLGNITATYALRAEDTTLVVMPLFHVHGLMGATLSTLRSGGMVVLPPRFSAGRFWTDVRGHAVTWYSAVPTIHQVLLMRAEEDGAVAGAFRLIRSSSAAMPPSVLASLEARFEAPVLEAYAMTEASHQMASNPLPPGVRKPGTVGRGTGVEITILDENGTQVGEGGEGEVSIKGRNVTLGYHKNAEANAAAFTDGWFRTGDQGRLDGDGYLSLTGRIKELINRGERRSRRSKSTRCSWRTPR